MLKTLMQKNNYPILFLIAIATTLRFYNLFELEYTYDELSALNRTEYDSLSEVIDKGVMKLDTHPALVQVFLYFYCKFFGTTEWIVKLPFIMAGIGSVFIVYQIGKKWFNETSALLTSSMLACTQYYIFYSVTARPYISGLLLSLLALKYLLDVLFDDTLNKRKYVLLSLFLALCALNHHFSMMFAALCGIVGLLFVSKKNALYYLLTCIGAVIIYSPHFPILLYQLKMGGIGSQSGGWLNPPENDFIIQYLYYVFHYSFIFVIVFVGIIISSSLFIKKNHQTSTTNKIRILLFSIFTLCFLIGFFYSQKVNPVIQYSTLIFASPCLLLFVCSYARELNLKLKWIAVGGLVIIGITTLVVKRKYYELIFNQPFDTYIQVADKTIKEKGNYDVYGLFKGEQWFLDYYKRKYRSAANYKVIENEALNSTDYKAIYDTLQTSYLTLGDFNPWQLLQASIYYPYVYQKTTGYNYEVYVLTKKPTAQNLDKEKIIIKSTNFSDIPEGFNYNKELIVNDNHLKYYKVDSLNEFPIAFKIKNKDLHCKEGETILAEISYQSEKPIKGQLCASTDANKQNIHWTANNMLDFYNSKSNKQKLYISIYVGPKFNYPDNELNIFVWNDHKETFKIIDFSICKWNNNPYRYGLLSDF